jgi:EAL domain-containing protein (putative c-di-GMP-specific phosphodiesterase class I)
VKRFPINYLKIDQAFIASLNMDDDSTPLVTAIIAMARSLNMKIIAEGIEQKTQLATLQRLSCHYVQGYYFAKPMPKDELLAWIDRYLNDSSFREVDL